MFYEANAIDVIIQQIRLSIITFKHFDTITFSNGMKPINILPRFEIEFKSFDINTGKKEWGAIPNKKYFVLKLGKILNKQNY